MHEKDEGNITTVDSLRNGAIIGDESVGGREVRVVELLEGGGIVLGGASGVRIVPRPILEIHSDFSDLVMVRFKSSADCPVFLQRVAFVQIGIAEPVPVV
jgi:hypothetical protein